jgi:hypothetical protein
MNKKENRNFATRRTKPRETDKGRGKGTWNRYEKEAQ